MWESRLEKRFTQFKSVHEAAPLLFKKIERVEAIMFLFFLSLMTQAFIEREVRLNMKEQNIEIWKNKLNWITEKGGMVLVNTHPDYMNFNSGETGIWNIQ